MLLTAHLRVAGADGNQRVALGLIEKDVDLVGGERLGHEARRLIQGRAQLGCVYAEQSLERLQEPVIPAGAAIGGRHCRLLPRNWQVSSARTKNTCE